jgi:hypothetical protein
MKTGFGNRWYTRTLNLLIILTITEVTILQLKDRAVYASSPHVQDLSSSQI